jgi:hypothetical protein
MPVDPYAGRMGAGDWVAEVDTSGALGPRLLIDGAEVPLSHYGFDHSPEADRWSFVIPSGQEDDGLVGFLRSLDPAEVEAAALERIQNYEGRPSPTTAAILGALIAWSRAGS